MSKSHYLKWFLPAGIAAASIILWKNLLDPELSVRFLYLTALGAITLIVLWKSDEQKFSKALTEILHWRNPAFLCIAIWLIATMLSLPNALQKSEGYVETARVVFFLFSYAWLSATFRFDSKNIIYVSIGFCITAFLLSAIGIKDFTSSFAQISEYETYYKMGNLGNRNLLAIMLSLCVPFHFILLERYQSKAVRVALSLNLLLCISVIMLTSSRVGWLGITALLMICLAVFLIAGIKGFIEKKTMLKLSLVFLAVVIAGAIPISFLLLKNPVAAEITKQRLKSFVDFRSGKNMHNESINERFHIWKSSIALIKEHPVAGVGAGNWKFRYAEKGLPQRAQKGSVVFLQPHNDFLWVCAETGAISGAAFITLFLSAIFTSSSFLLKKNKPHGGLSVALAVLSGISMYAVHSCFDFPKERPLISFAFISLLALASALSERDERRFFSIKTSRVVIIALLFISLISAWVWIARMQGELNLKKALAARATGYRKGLTEHLEKISPVFFESDLNGIPIDWYRSELAYQRADRASFKKHSESALAQNPYQLYNLYNLGSIYYKEGNVETAIQYWEKAVSIAPRFADAAVNLSAAYYNRKNYERAAYLLSKPEIDYSNKSYSAIVTSVLGRYIYMMSDSISDNELREALKTVSLDAVKIQALQRKMSREGTTIRNAALQSVLSDKP